MKFIANCNDDLLKQRFNDCYNQFFARAQKFAPRNRDEIDQLVQEALPEVISEPEKAVSIKVQRSSIKNQESSANQTEEITNSNNSAANIDSTIRLEKDNSKPSIPSNIDENQIYNPCCERWYQVLQRPFFEKRTSH